LLENLEHEIFMLSEKQIKQTKTVIKFNKENARQIAVSQKEAVTLAVQDLKGILAGGVAVTAVQEEPDFAEDIVIAVEEPDSAEDLVAVEELLPEEPVIIGETQEVELPEFLTPEDVGLSEEDIMIMDTEQEEEPELPPIEDIVLDDFMLDESQDLTELLETAQEEEPLVEEPIQEAAPESPVINSDPNAMMTPEDIAKLIASMGQ